MVFRIFIEKKKGLENSAKNLRGFIRNYVSLEPESDVRIFERFDFDGLTKEEFDTICKKVLINEMTDTPFVDYLPLTSNWRSFAVAPKDGTFDERVFGIKNNARIFGINANFKVRYAKVIAVSELLNDYKLEEIKKLLVDNDLFWLPDNNKALSIEEEFHSFGAVSVDGDFLEKNDVQIYQFLNKTSLNMTKEMLCIIRDYFRLLKRNPTLVELYAIDSVLRSKLTPENYRFKEINFEESPNESPLKITMDEFVSLREQAGIDKTGTISLKDIAMAGYDYMKQKGQIQDIVMENKQPIIQVPVDVNGVIEQYLISFKASKANKYDEFDVYPNKSFSKLEAYQSLCLDCQPYISKNDRKFSNCTYDNVTSGDYITSRVAQMNRELGISSALGGQIFSKSIKKPVGFTATAFSGTKPSYSLKLAEGDCIVMLGSKMRMEDLSGKGFKQKQNFMLKEKINQFFKLTENEFFIKKTVDFSDGIIAGLLNEFYGVEIDINRIVAVKNLYLSHIALSTINCRAAVVVSKENVDKIKAICSNISLSSHVIGEIKKEPYLVITNGKKQVANVSTEFINSLYNIEKHSVLIKDLSNKKIDVADSYSDVEKLGIKDAFLQNLKNISICSKKGVSSNFDSTLNGGCVLAPFGGKNEITPTDAFVSKIPTSTGNTNTVTAISYGCNPRISSISPYHGAAFSIMECISKIVATGANSINTKLGICQNVSDPKGFSTKYGNLFSAIFGAFQTEIGMNIPSISYDLSFDKQTDDVIDFSCFSIAVLKANEVISPEFKSSGSTIILVPMPIVQKTGLPDYDKAKVMYRQIHYLSQNGKVLSAGVVNEGGIAALVAKMSFGNGIGVDFENTDIETLFSAKTASIVIETKNPGAFSGMDTIVIGKTISEQNFVFDNDVVSLGDALAAYTGSTQSFYPTRSLKKTAMAKIEPFEVGDNKLTSSIVISKPKVIIPVFSSFSGANECKRAFENAGGEVDVYCINPKDFQNSINALAQKIDESQILCLPSGELNSYSTEFGYNVMMNSSVSQAVTNLVDRQGLVLGFQEGFDILLRTGLLTKGEYGEYERGAYLAPSIISMPSSSLVRTKIVSDKSPWMSMSKTGEVYSQPVFHNNCRFVSDETTMMNLLKNNQIVAQYVDKNDKVSGKLPFNPDGSICAIESISSPDGRILGKSALLQRKTRGCFANILDTKELHIFDAGIKYFKG